MICNNCKRSSSSLTQYRSSHEIKNWDVTAIGFQPSTVNCSRATPRPEREASLGTRVSSCGL